MDAMYEKIKAELSSKFSAKIRMNKRELFDDVIIYVSRQNRSKVISYIFSNYKKIMKLRVDNDDQLIYAYCRASEDKIRTVKENMVLYKHRFKWLYEQIKDEEVFLKNVEKINEELR